MIWTVSDAPRAYSSPHTAHWTPWDSWRVGDASLRVLGSSRSCNQIWKKKLSKTKRTVAWGNTALAILQTRISARVPVGLRRGPPLPSTERISSYLWNLSDFWKINTILIVFDEKLNESIQFFFILKVWCFAVSTLVRTSQTELWPRSGSTERQAYFEINEIQLIFNTWLVLRILRIINENTCMPDVWCCHVATRAPFETSGPALKPQSIILSE